jgi:hypothetical protein
MNIANQTLNSVHKKIHLPFSKNLNHYYPSTVERTTSPLAQERRPPARRLSENVRTIGDSPT